MRTLPAVLSALSLTSTLCAQSFVSPPHFAATEGSYFANGALGGTDQNARLLQVHDDLKGAPRMVNVLSFRRDNLYSGGNGSGGNRPAFSIVADVFCSTAAVSASAMAATFAQNHGTDRAQTATMKRFDFPAAPHFVMPGPWSFVLPFDRTFAFGGGSGLCWEVVVHGRTNTSTVINLDGAYGASANPGPWSWGFVGGCKASGQTEPMLLSTGGSNIQWNVSRALFRFNGLYLPRSANVILAIGTSTSRWGNLTLPYALPGTATALSGECTIATDWAIQVPLPTTAAGTIDQSYPNIPVWNGLSMFSQLAALDAGANAWGIVTSNGQQTHVLAPFGAPQFGTVQATSHAATGVATSYPSAGGYVVKFD